METETEVSDLEMVGGSEKLKGRLSTDLPRGQIAQKSSGREMVGGSQKLKGLLSTDLPRGQIAQKSSGRETSWHEDLLVKLEKELLELEELKKQGGPNKLKDMPEHHTLQMLDSGSGSGKKIAGWKVHPSSENQNLLRRVEFVSDKIRCLRHNLLLEKGLIKPKVRPEGPDTYMEEITIQDFVMSKAIKRRSRGYKSDILESDGADGGLHKEMDEMGRGKSATEERLMDPVTQEKKAEQPLNDSGDDGTGEMDRGNSAMEEQVPRVDSEATMGLNTSMVESDRQILKPTDPSPNILDSGGESMVKSDQLILEPAFPCPDILDCGGDDKKDEMDKGKSAIEEQVPRIDSEATIGLNTSMVESHRLILKPADPSPNILDSGGESMVKSDQLILKPAFPCPDILDCGGDDKKDEMEKGKSAMEEQVPQTDSEFKSEMGAGSVMRSDTNEGASTVKSAKLIIEPADPSPTNTMTRLEQYSVQDDSDHGKMDRGTSGTLLTVEAKEKAAEEMAHEAEMFAWYIEGWESEWGQTCGSFTDQTVLSSMQFVHYTPGHLPRIRCGSTPETLQVFSIKLTEIAGGLQWPLSVYGVIAARDMVDHNRNLIFSCDRSHAQELKQDDSFLRLIGPSRAILFEDMLDFEIQLKVKGRTQSEDEALIRHACSYAAGVYGPGVTIENCFCTLELCLQRVILSVQATILSVQVVKGSWPFEYGGRVACYSLAGEFVRTDNGVVRVIEPSSSQIVLIDSKDEAELKGFHGYVHLSRRVVSVGTRGKLVVEIQAYSKSGDTATRGHVSLLPKLCNISHEKCDLDGAEVVFTVAWSLVPTDKRDAMAEGWSGSKVI